MALGHHTASLSKPDYASPRNMEYLLQYNLPLQSRGTTGGAPGVECSPHERTLPISKLNIPFDITHKKLTRRLFARQAAWPWLVEGWHTHCGTIFTWRSQTRHLRAHWWRHAGPASKCPQVLDSNHSHRMASPLQSRSSRSVRAACEPISSG